MRDRSCAALPFRGLALCLVASSALWPAAAAAAFPTLDVAVARARTQALAMSEARGQVAVAQSAMPGARVAPLANPYLEVQVDRGRYTQDVQISGLAFFPLELHGQRGARIEEADKLVAWRQQDYLDAQARVTGEAIFAYGDAVVSAARVAEASRAEQDARTELGYFTQRLAVADVTLFEKSLSEAEVSRWAQARAEAELRLIDAQATLAQLTGEGDLEGPPTDAAPRVPELRSAWGAPSMAAVVDASPLLRALAAEATYWDASRGRLASEKNPPVNLILVGGRGDDGELRAGGGMSWTLPVLRKNQSEIARADAERARVVAFAAAARNVLRVRVKAAHASYVTSRDAVAEQEKSGIPAAERVVDAANALYRAGKGELIRVLIARRDLALARARRLDLIAAAWRAYGALAALKGELP